jgi:hypothetical protein
VFVEFQTTRGLLTLNADKIVSYQHMDEDECTLIQTSDGGAYSVLEHPTQIKKALETHTCVVPVLETGLHVVPGHGNVDVHQVAVDEAEVDGDRTKVVVRDMTGQVLGQWETDRDGNHTPS